MRNDLKIYIIHCVYRKNGSLKKKIIRVHTKGEDYFDLPPILCTTKYKPKMTKRAPLAKLLYQISFSTLQLLELQHKQHGWGIGRMQQNQQACQDPNLSIMGILQKVKICKHQVEIVEI